MYRQSSRGRQNNRRRFHGRRRGPSSKGRFVRNGPSRDDFSQYINKVSHEEREAIVMSTVSYADLKVNDVLKNNIRTKGYTHLMPIQEKVIPEILSGRDVVGIANTGTGKTAAFLIPMVEKVYGSRSQKVLILAPTRELASQICDELSFLSKDLGMNHVLCVGGVNIQGQLRRLRNPYSFLICTPGRLKDLVMRKAVRLDSFNNVIVDEVDRMFDMGFYKEIKIVLDSLPVNRQTMFFSATVDGNTKSLIQAYVKDPVTVSVNQRASSSNVEQDIIRVAGEEAKVDMLHNLLVQDGFSKVLIFGKTKYGVDRLQKELVVRGFKADAIHGNKNYSARVSALTRFKNNVVNILVATDVAARGLDIADISHVINFDIPATYDDYIHRIGRTGRGNRKGKALTFV